MLHTMRLLGQGGFLLSNSSFYRLGAVARIKLQLLWRSYGSHAMSTLRSSSSSWSCKLLSPLLMSFADAQAYGTSTTLHPSCHC